MIDHRFETLLKLITRINSQSSLDELLGSIMESAKKLNHAEASSLMLADDANSELIIAIPTGPAQAEISGLRIPQDKGIAGWVKTNNEPAIVNDPKTDSRFLGEISKSSFTTKNLICVPLRNARGKVIGVLQSINHLDSDVFEEDDLILLQALADQAALAIEKENYHQKEIQAQRVTEQLNTARNIQQQFLPTNFPQLDGYSLYGESVPALEVGGDYFDFFDFRDGRVGFVIADVVGKGVPAALLMATIRSVMKTLAFTDINPDVLVSQVNTALKADMNSGQFVTLFYGELDATKKIIRYVNAGHNPPYLKTDGGALEELHEGGPIVGMLDGLTFEMGERPFGKDTFLYLFTDGVTEAMKENGDQYEEERLMDFIEKNHRMAPEKFCKALIEDMDAFTGEKEQDDDRTMIAISSF